MQLLLPGQDTAGGAADGLAAYFSNNFSNALGDEDSYKLTNLDENVAIASNGSLLSIEGRKPVTANDTLQIRISRLLHKNYFFKISLHNFSSAINCFLEDAYLQTITSINPGANTLIPFGITSDTASFSINRFKTVFRTAAVLPVGISGISAYLKNKGVEVQWTVAEENNINCYEIERSDNARQFFGIGQVEASKNSSLANKYSWFDNAPHEGENFYRLKITDKAGDIKYSYIVKVTFAGSKCSMVIFPNPVSGNTINLQLKNLEKGNHVIKLLTVSGKEAYSAKITYDGSSSSKAVKIKPGVASGIYQLQLINGSNNVGTIAVFK